MTTESPSDSLDDAARAAQRPASNLLLAGTALSLALAVSAVVGLSNNEPAAIDPSSTAPVPAGPIAASWALPQTTLTGLAPISLPQITLMDRMELGRDAAVGDDIRISAGRVSVEEMAAALAAAPAAPTSSAAPPQRPATAYQVSSPASTGPDSAAARLSASDDSTSAFGAGKSDHEGSASSAGGGPSAAGGAPGGLAGGNGNGQPGGDSGKPSGGPGGNGPGGDGPGGNGPGANGPGNGPAGGGPGGDGPGGDGPGNSGGRGGHGGHGGAHGR